MWMTVFLCLGRAAGPPLGSYLVQNHWAISIVAIIAVNVVLVGFVYKRLV